MATMEVGNFLLDCYDQYFGSFERANHRRVYLGFGMVMMGTTLLVAGWSLFFWSESITAIGPGTSIWAVREAAFASAGVGIPLLLLGSVSLLTADRFVAKPAITYTMAGGSVLCLLALVVFVLSYPDHWDVIGQQADHSPVGVTLYGAGMVAMLLATGSAIGCRCTIAEWMEK